MSLRVIGGNPVAAITSFPFQVALFTRSAGGGFGQQTLAFCGGVIIDATQVATAAHCVTDQLTGQPVSPQLVTVLAGTAMLPPTVPPQPVAASIAVDPLYDPQTANYDIAVVTLAAPLYNGSPRADGTASVAPIPLITPLLAERFANPNVIPAEPVVISGWGETSPLAIGAPDPSASLPQQLQAAQTHLVPDATCAAAYRRLGSIGVPPISPQMLCAGEQATATASAPDGAIDACAGDSGGPLVVDIDTPATPPGDLVLAGLIDFGAGCAQTGYPGVYVRIATPEINSFINQQAQAHGQQLPPPPVSAGLAPPRHGIAASGTARLATSRTRVRNRVTRLAVRCATAPCTGTLTLRTTTTVGIAHFAIPANSTTRVPVRITPRGQRQLDRHHRLRVRATLHTTGSPPTHRALTITD
ncbi:MAG: S1 family serine peptidase [Solirubrobacteraceae bacterium]